MQTWIARKTAYWLSSELGTKISVRGLDVTWFLDVVIEDVTINDRHNKVLLESSTIKLDVEALNIRQKYLIIDLINIDNANLNLLKYHSDTAFNYSFLADYFKGEPDSSVSEPWAVSLKAIKLNKSKIRYQDLNTAKVADLIDYNHLELSNLNIDADNISLKGDSLNLRLNNLSAHEYSGFKLHRLNGDISLNKGLLEAKNLRLITNGSNIKTDLKFTFTNFSSFSNFIDSVNIESTFDNSIFDLSDLKYFTTDVKGMENIIHFNGVIKGKVSSLKARKFHFEFGSNSSFDGDISMDGLPDINETFIHLKVKSLNTDYYDLTNIRLPGNKKLELPKEVKNAGIIDIKGFFTGFIYDFVSSADFYTSIGKLETDLSLQTGKGKLLIYNGQFNLQKWNIGKMFEISDKVGEVSLTSTVNGEVLNKQHNNINIDAIVGSVRLLNNEFNDITIKGNLNNRLFNGNLAMNDELAVLNFKGMVDFTDKIPEFNFTADLKEAYLAKLNLWDHDQSSKISTHMDLNFKGSNLDNLLGSLRFDSTKYSEFDRTYFISKIELATENINHNTKKLSLKSDLVDASFYGMFTFNDFYTSLSNIVSQYLPSLNIVKSENQEVASIQMFDYSFQVKNAKPITEIFLPELSLLSEASIYGNYNSNNNTIILNGLAGDFLYRGIHFSDWYIKSKNLGSSIQINTGVSSIMADKDPEDNKEGLLIENFVFKAYMQGDTVKYDLGWNDKTTDDHNTGQIDGFFAFSDFPRIHASFENFNLVINDKRWIAKQQDDVIIDSTSIAIKEIDIESINQKLKLYGKISSDPGDILTLNFKDLDISNADLLINVKNVDFDGVLSGSVNLKDLYNTRRMEAEVQVKDFAFNKEKMGDANIKTIWNNEISAMDVQVDVINKGNISTHQPITAKGVIYTAKREEGNFDLDVIVKNYKLASLNPFMRGIASNIRGYASGALKLEGTFNRPVITGELDLLRSQAKIDYLNVTYSFAHKVNVEKELISANGITIYDSLGNTAKMDFNLKHQNFRKIDMNIDIAANNINSLNTTYKNNSLFYGSAFGTGKVNISGSFKEVDIKIDAESKPNSIVYIPINLAVDASENDFIRFINPNTSQNEKQETYLVSESGTNVDINLQVTDDASIQLFLPENIGNIKGTGNGNIQMNVNKQGELTMYGDYVMDQGSFLFTLGNVINRVFSIENGSNISFNGSPYDADISLSAVYHLRASVKDLPQEYGRIAVPVDCIIRLENDLYNPDISFSIRLPEENPELNRIIYSAIDTTDQAMMTQQMVSLLVLKKFALSSTNTLSSSVGSSSIEVLTDQLSNMLSQIIKDVDIGVKYRTGDELTDEEVEVALSTNLFNDRVSIDGNVGMYTTGTTQNTGGIVGDVVVDVKVTPDGRLRVKAFNKSDPFEISAASVNPYKQGIGVYYRYEFDKFSDIFRRKKKKQ